MTAQQNYEKRMSNRGKANKKMRRLAEFTYKMHIRSKAFLTDKIMEVPEELLCRAIDAESRLLLRS